MPYQAQVFAKTFLYVREACKYTDKGNYFAMYMKNNICISCVFNSYKYSLNMKKILLI